MKLRIQGNSIRYRVTQSDVARLLASKRIEDTIYFTADGSGQWTYAIEAGEGSSLQLQHRPSEVVVVLPAGMVTAWARSETVGIYETLELGVHGTLSVMIEKDFACLDRSEEENRDSYPNPNAGALC